MAFTGRNRWESAYSAEYEAETSRYILSSRFDNVFLRDLEATFLQCMRTDSGNELVAPLNVYNYRIINVAAPTQDTDAANAKYVKDTVYKYEGIKVETSPQSGTYSFATSYANGITQYSMAQGGALTFALPTPSNTNVVNQIMCDFKANGASVNLGTAYTFERSLTSFAANRVYTIIWEWSNQLSAWVVGVMLKANQ